ncbi:MAG: hypothetical protein EBZ59_05055 [Planctomycetia bacterium]|nr:hypothetical protein [Planctomycetia bacterium]
MFRRQEIFDATLRPFIDNPHVTAIYFLCRPEEQPFWLADVLPKLRKCDHGDKVRVPLWGAIRVNVSFVLGDVDGDGRDEAVVTVLDEPFSASNHGSTVPRFLMRVYSHCDLMAPLEEMARHATSEFISSAGAEETGRPPSQPPAA